MDDMLGDTMTCIELEVNCLMHDEAKAVLSGIDVITALSSAVDITTRLQKLGYAILPLMQYGKQTKGICVPQCDQHSETISSHDMMLDSLMALAVGFTRKSNCAPLMGRIICKRFVSGYARIATKS